MNNTDLKPGSSVNKVKGNNIIVGRVIAPSRQDVEVIIVEWNLPNFPVTLENVNDLMPEIMPGAVYGAAMTSGYLSPIEFSVYIINPGPNKFKLIAVVKEYLDCSLFIARDLVNNMAANIGAASKAPFIHELSKYDAEILLKKLESAGATAEIVPTS